MSEEREDVVEDTQQGSVQPGDEVIEGEQVDVGHPPSSANLALLSVFAFVAILFAGAGIGLVRGDGSLTGGTRAPAAIATAAVEPPLDAVTVVEPPAPVAAVAPIEDLVIPTESVDQEDQIVAEVAGVVDEVIDAEPKPLVILELAKPLYDRFELSIGDAITTNVAANDEVGGVLQSVRLTGWGELAPGFMLAPDGTLSGTASECGDWQAQYELISDNPASGSSFIDITVRDCVDLG